MPTPRLQAELERIGAERLAAQREVERAARRGVWLALLGCVASCAAGMLILAFAFLTKDRQLGFVFFWSGLTLGYAGMAYSLLSAYRRGEARGDW